MKICPKCNAANSDDTKYCTVCGTKISKWSKKFLIIGLCLLLVIVILVYSYINAGYLKFAIAYDMGKYDIAAEAMDEAEGNNSAKIDKFIVGKMENYYNEYKSEKITYSECRLMFIIAKKFTDDTEFEDKAAKLSDSRSAFIAGKECEENGDILNAALNYVKVIDSDNNCAAAQEFLKSNRDNITNVVLQKLEALMAENDYKSGLALIDSLYNVVPTGGEINRYREGFEKIKTAREMLVLKEEQKVKVLSAKAYNDGYYTIIRKGSVVVYNDTDDVLKEYTVGILMFDNNGYPVDVEYSYKGDGNCFAGRSQSANVQPYKTYGNNCYWYISDNATKIKACVKSAEFYNSGSWENPYYDYWLETEKDKF